MGGGLDRQISTRRLEPLDVDTCLGLLAQGFFGRLAYVAADRPRIVPMNYLLHEGSVLLRTDYGALLDGVAGQAVAFEVDAVDFDSHTGWSVVVGGRAEEVWTPAELEVVRELPLHPWAPGDRSHYLRILSTSITGRRIV